MTKPEYIFTTVSAYRDNTPECTGDFFGQDGSLLDDDYPITICEDTQEWCAGHDPANATWESLV